MNKDVLFERYFTIMVGIEKILGMVRFATNGFTNLSLQVCVEGEAAHPATSIGSVGFLHKYIRGTISETEDVKAIIAGTIESCIQQVANNSYWNDNYKSFVIGI